MCMVRIAEFKGTVGKASITQQRFPSDIPHTPSRFQFTDVTGLTRTIHNDTGNVSRMIEVMLEGSGRPQGSNGRTDYTTNNNGSVQDEKG